MQLTIATASAIIATASAAGFAKREYNQNSTCDTSLPLAKVVNRCDYPVYLWSIDKELGCPAEEGLLLETGAFYNENLKSTANGGISIKISKSTTCNPKKLTQLEYKLVHDGETPGDYLDMSFVNCQTGDCPGWHDGFYFKAGNTPQGKFKAAVNNEHCPIFQVSNAVEAALVSYVNPDDRQTKWCDLEASMELHICGSHEPDSIPIIGGGGNSQKAKPSKSKSKGHHQEKPSPSKVASTPEVSVPAVSAPAYSAVKADVAEAAITPAPEPTKPVKTEVVYETVYVKRHAHGRRHQHFHA